MPFAPSDANYPDSLLQREFLGYGLHVPNAQWPGDAKIAVSFIVNVPYGAEQSVENGDEGAGACSSSLSLLANSSRLTRSACRNVPSRHPYPRSAQGQAHGDARIELELRRARGYPSPSPALRQVRPPVVVVSQGTLELTFWRTGTA